MIHSLHLDSFYLTEEQLENSPSRQDGIDKDTEANLRMYGCEIIQEAGIMLSFAQVVMATGQVLLHRFYCKRSMKTFNVKKVAATALWVAAKLEEVRVVREHPRLLIEMVMVTVDRCITRRETPEGRKLTVLDSHSKEGEEFRRALIRYESEMLKAFGFIMNVEHPHRLLCNYCQIMFTPYLKKDAAPEKKDFLQSFIQQSWNIANDSLRTTLCVRFKGSVVACGIIFYTARKLQVPLPDDWWELFLVKLEDMCEVCRVLHELYLAPKPWFIPVCHQLLPSKPPTPAIDGVAVKGAAVTATPTPMMGASPALGMRPGDKPLDPSIRRTIPASESTPNLAAAAAAAGAVNGAAGSTLASPQEAPGSARKRSRSRSPASSAGGDSRKRQQLDSGDVPLLGPGQAEQLQQQAKEAVAAAGSKLSRPRSAAGDRDRERDRDRDRDRDYKRSDRDGRSSQRDRPRSRSQDKRRRSSSRDRSRRSRSRSRDRKGGYSRDKSRRSRSRDRKRSRSRDRRRSRSRSPDRRRDYRDGRGRSNQDRSDRRDRPDRGRDEKSRELKSPAKPAPKEQQQPKQQEEEGDFKFPSPPPDPARADSPGKPQQAAEQDPAADARKGSAAAGAGGKESQQRSSRANGVGTSRNEKDSEQGERTAPDRPGPSTAAEKAGLPPMQPKPKPKAVRKQHPAGAVASPVSSPSAKEGKAAPGAD